MTSVRGIMLCLIAPALLGASSAGASRPLGLFTRDSDIGTVAQPGSTRFDPGTGIYRMVGNGDDLWAAKDDFHFASRRVAGDVSISATVTPVADSAEPHSKAGLMIREDLRPDSPYADLVVHENGLVALQYRQTRGGVTYEIRVPEAGPRRLELQRRGDYVVILVADDAGTLHRRTGYVRVKLPKSCFVGLLVCSHSNTRTKLVDFAAVTLTTP